MAVHRVVETQTELGRRNKRFAAYITIVHYVVRERNGFYMTSHERNEFQTAVNLVLDFAECMKKDYGYE